ncbi:hypothetical protein LX81_01734 [Palleronia aestuarii]|uniref:Sulfotransferase family protein n=2 Tax=Palleronia aestuarii TaxID=568105 RepID=A0A2W7NBV6_9RHOB|nr:hypothetical protein LX81_01734 [Palleronia aestuarii]
MGNSDQPAFWRAHAEGKEVDWAEVFADYFSQVDFPGAPVWHELSVAFPDAKVVHTERLEEEWWASYSATIGKFFEYRESLVLPPPKAENFEAMERLLIRDVMGGPGKAAVLSAYRRNNEKVRATIPADRLLVFTPSDGWEPLCAFLGVARPEGDFPRSIARDEFWALFGGEPVSA